MDFKIATWNIRSMNKGKKQKEIKILIMEERIQVCAVLETHIKPHKLPKVCESSFGDWDWFSNVQYSLNGCRILVRWDRNMVDMGMIHSSKQFILCMIEILANKTKFLCSFIYAANSGKVGKNYGETSLEIKEFPVGIHGQ